MIPMSSMFRSSVARRDPGASPNHQAAFGCAWLTAWSGTLLFVLGAAFLAFIVVTGDAGPYAAGAIWPAILAVFGVVTLGAAAAMWAVYRIRGASHPRLRSAAALGALAGAAALLGTIVANQLGWLALPAESWPVAVGGVTLLALGALLAADPWERRPALAFAATWVLFLGIVTYRTWTDLRVEVVWFGRGIDSPAAVAFEATRSGEFELRFGAHTCQDGSVIASGRYEWAPGDPGSSFGAPAWIDLPADLLPIEKGYVVRVCVRDGPAAGTGAAESGGPGMGFWPRD
jgi:hypothetical protein